MHRAAMEQWVAAYERAWRTAGTEALREIFSDDVSYRPSPWAEPLVGLDRLAAFWDAERKGPDEEFTMTHEVVAVDGATTVVRVQVEYGEPGQSRWRDLWVLRFADDGRCLAFEEWPFSPAQPDGH